MGAEVGVMARAVEGSGKSFPPGRGGAKDERVGACSTEVQMSVVLPGEPDATVQLNGLRADKAVGLIAPNTCHRCRFGEVLANTAQLDGPRHPASPPLDLHQLIPNP